jgi:hypothetical protein
MIGSRVTEEPLGLQAVVDGGDSWFGGVDRVAVSGARGGEDECLEGQAPVLLQFTNGRHTGQGMAAHLDRWLVTVHPVAEAN